jgi:hypothetical protein
MCLGVRPVHVHLAPLAGCFRLGARRIETSYVQPQIHTEVVRSLDSRPEALDRFGLLEGRSVFLEEYARRMIFKRRRTSATLRRC